MSISHLPLDNISYKLIYFSDALAQHFCIINPFYILIFWDTGFRSLYVYIPMSSNCTEVWLSQGFSAEATETDFEWTSIHCYHAIQDRLVLALQIWFSSQARYSTSVFPYQKWVYIRMTLVLLCYYWSMTASLNLINCWSELFSDLAWQIDPITLKSLK